MTTNGGAIEAARQKRERLHTAMCDLEASVSAPSRVSTWIGDLSKRLDATRNALIDHIAEVEGPSGIIARIVDDAPRLSADAGILLNDHPILTARADEVTELVRNAGPEPKADAVKMIREASLELLGMLSRHRHLGADLVYDAYLFDIGGQS